MDVNRCCFRPFVLALVLIFTGGCLSKMELPANYPERKARAKKVPKKVPQPPPKQGYTRPYQVFGQWYYPLTDAAGFRELGIASWYGEDFHGRPTSNGEIYNMHGISAAHKILPIGTVVRVYNLENRKYLDVRINDRGPFVAGRVIDLSYGAAKLLGLVGPGLAQVKVVSLGKPTRKGDGKRRYEPVDYRHGNFTIQVGAFSSRENAEQLASELDGAYGHAKVLSDLDHRSSQKLHRVLVGKCDNLDEALKYANLLREKGFSGAFTVAVE